MKFELKTQVLKDERLRKFAQNSLWLIGDKIVRLAFGVLVGAWVARYLGPAQYGELAYAISFCAFFQAFAALGLDGVAVRELSRNQGSSSSVLGTVIRLRIGAGLIGWFGAVAAILLSRPGDHESLILVMIVAAGIVFQAADAVDLWFQSQSQSRKTVKAKAIGFLFTNAVKVVLVLTESPLWCFALSQLLETAVGALMLTMALRSQKIDGGGNWSSQVANDLLRKSWPFIISSISIIAYMRIDQVMIRSLAGEVQLGLYSAVMPFSQAWNFIPVMVCSSALPFLAKDYAQNEEAFFLKLRYLFFGLGWVAVCIIIFMHLCGDALVTRLLGEAYLQSADLLKVHVITNYFIFLGVVQSQWILASGKSKISLYKTFFGAVVNITCNYILIPKFGAIGAAYSAVIAQAASTWLSNLLLAPKIFWFQLFALVPPQRMFRREMK